MELKADSATELAEPAGATVFQRLEELFLAASELPEDRQRAFLEQQESDAELRAEVLELLGHSADAESRVGAAVDAGLSWVAADEPDHPARLGPYRVLGELGRGGLGVVYLAERDDEQFHMRVAIKVVRPGLGHRELEKRLQRERQILAGLEHPHIARVLDGGTTDEGAPFLVMELVDGEPITDYCRRHDLSVERRLRLFQKVCDAVHYAHRSLVLHRDLKPSNILVTEGDLPKLLDFGIAKMLEGPREWLDGATAATLTNPGMRLLTPEYASPEQVLGLPLTTSSDIYSLGVLLHELLTGDRPYDFDRHRPSEIERKVCEEVPERPSVSHRRLSGRDAPWDADLDNIVAMVLRKEPERRYASALQLGEDIRNYLSDLPVAARADTFTYRMSKFVRRHRAAVSAAAVVLATLVAAVILTSYQAGVAQRERQRAEASLEVAERERLHAQGVADFMVTIFENSDPSRSRRASVTVREVLDQGARQIAWEQRTRPLLRQTLMTTMAKVYRQLDLYDEAEALLEKSRALQSGNRRGQAGSAGLSDQEIGSIRELGLLRLDQGRPEPAERLLRSSVRFTELRHGSGSPMLAEHLMDLGRVLQARDAQDEAEEVMLRALDIRVRTYGERSPEVAEIRDRIAELYYARGEYERAETLCRQALKDRRRALGEHHPDVAISLNNLAVIRLALADFKEATELLKEALQLRRRLYGDIHGSVAQSLLNLGSVHLQQRDVDEAEPLLVQSLEVYETVYGRNHSEVAEALFNLSIVYRLKDDVPRAESTLRRVLEIRRNTFGDAHPSVVQSLLELARLYRRSDLDRAEAQFREAIELQSRTLAPDDYRRSYALLELGRLLLARGSVDEAEALSKQAFDLRRQTLPAGHWETALARAQWGRCLAARGESTAGLEHLQAALATIVEHLGENHRRVREVRRWLDGSGEPGSNPAEPR